MPPRLALPASVVKRPPVIPTPRPVSTSWKARIAKVIAYVESITPEQINAGGDRSITIPTRGEPHVFENGGEYLTQFAIPNFFFHVTTAWISGGFYTTVNVVSWGATEFIKTGYLPALSPTTCNEAAISAAASSSTALTISAGPPISAAVHTAGQGMVEQFQANPLRAAKMGRALMTWPMVPKKARSGRQDQP
jgi:hypothetical protein